MAGSSWDSLAHRSIIQTFAFIFICHSLYVYVSIQMFSFFIRTPGNWDEEWPFWQQYFILTNKTYKDSSHGRLAAGVNLGKYKLTPPITWKVNKNLGVNQVFLKQTNNQKNNTHSQAHTSERGGREGREKKRERERKCISHSVLLEDGQSLNGLLQVGQPKNLVVPLPTKLKASKQNF